MKTWEGHRRTKYVRKRDIKPTEWYIIDLSNPLLPNVPSKHYPKRKDWLPLIERYYGLNALVFPIIGAILIKHGQLLNCTTTRKWGVVFRKYEYPTDANKRVYRANQRKVQSG